MLLNLIKGPTSYEEIRTIDGIVHPTFQSACKILGLLDDDQEWHQALNEAAQWSTSFVLRELFVTLIIFCDIGDPKQLLHLHWDDFGEDILSRVRALFKLPTLRLSVKGIKAQILFELEALFNKNGTPLKQYGLPMPNKSLLHDLDNKLIFEELNYNIDQLITEHEENANKLNDDQRKIYDVVLRSVYDKKPGLFFVYGHGGIGKTFLYKEIIAKLCSGGKIVLVVASSGIASLLLPGGRTTHSRFKIPLNIEDIFTCPIKKNTQLANLIIQTSFIVWDEAPMAHKHCFEAVDKTLQDILTPANQETNTKPFGGKPVLLGGDFRQIRPVVVNGTRHGTIHACITNSYLWKHCKVYMLKTNMRLSLDGLNDEERKTTAFFANWILAIGDGKVPYEKSNNDEEQNWIQIPTNMLISPTDDDVQSITTSIYDNFTSFYDDWSFLKERSILTPTNDVVDKINTHMISLVPTQEKIYLSFDIISPTSTCSEEEAAHYDPEFLHDMKLN